MKHTRIFIPLSISFLFLFYLLSCNKTDRQVVPVDTDSDEVFTPIEPNDDENPLEITYGPDSISGITFNFDMQTNDSDVYVFLNNFTILDLNPKINEAIFDFIAEIMKENDFMPESYKNNTEVFSDLRGKGIDLSNAADSALQSLKTGFENQLDSLRPLSSPFNMDFLIYPVFLDKNYVTYRLFSSCYTGGAHGQTFSYLKTFDLVSGDCLTLDDIVKPDGLLEVKEEVVAHMAYSYPIYENIATVNQYMDSLNVWLDNFDPNDEQKKITVEDFPLPDPAITRQGLAFIYQMYELTPGSDGCPLIVIPYNDIRGCLYSQFELQKPVGQ